MRGRAHRGRTGWLPFRPGVSGILRSPGRGVGHAGPGAGGLVVDEVDGLLGGGVDGGGCGEGSRVLCGGLLAVSGGTGPSGVPAMVRTSHRQDGQQDYCGVRVGHGSLSSGGEPGCEGVPWDGVGHPGCVRCRDIQRLSDGYPAVGQVEEPFAAGVAGPLEALPGFALGGEGEC